MSAPLLKVFAQIIADKGVATLGQDLFVGYMPPEIDIGVAILGTIMPRRIDWNMPPFRKDVFQVVVRHIDCVNGFGYCDRIKNALTITEETKRDGIKINYIHARHHPIMFPRLDSDNFEFSINYNYCVAL